MLLNSQERKGTRSVSTLLKTFRNLCFLCLKLFICLSSSFGNTVCKVNHCCWSNCLSFQQFERLRTVHLSLASCSSLALSCSGDGMISAFFHLPNFHQLRCFTSSRPPSSKIVFFRFLRVWSSYRVTTSFRFFGIFWSQRLDTSIDHWRFRPLKFQQFQGQFFQRHNLFLWNNFIDSNVSRLSCHEELRLW